MRPPLSPEQTTTMRQCGMSLVRSIARCEPRPGHLRRPFDNGFPEPCGSRRISASHRGRACAPPPFHPGAGRASAPTGQFPLPEDLQQDRILAVKRADMPTGALACSLATLRDETGDGQRSILITVVFRAAIATRQSSDAASAPPTARSRKREWGATRYSSSFSICRECCNKALTARRCSIMSRVCVPALSAF